MKSQLLDNDIEMYSIHNKGNLLLLKDLFRISKNTMYKYMTSVPKIVYIDKLDGLVNKHNIKYRTIKMKPVDVELSAYIDLRK